MNKPVIDGYVFSSAMDTDIGKKEYMTIQKLKQKINIEDMEGTLTLYNRLVSKQIFSSPIGLGFLHEMRGFLLENVDEQRVLPIYVPAREAKEIKTDFSTKQFETLKEERNRLVVAKRNMMIAIVALVAVIVAMFFIVITNENLGYFNAEEKVLNKYAAWEERLEAWEEELIEREELLEQKENSLE